MPLHLKILLWFTICMLRISTAFAQDIHFTTVDPPKDNPWAGLFGITQDSQGYLWIATGVGLFKYDGHQYTFYHQEPFNTNSLGFDHVECITAGKDGMIWLGTYGKGLDRLEPVTNTFTHYRHRPGDAASLANDTVTAIIEDHKGIIWLGTRLGLDRLDPQTGKFSHYANDPKDPRSLSNNGVRVVYEDRQGTIWVGTGTPFDGTNKYMGGLNRLDQRTNKFTRYLHDDHNPQSLIDSRVRAIFEDSRGTFWVGTAGDGLHTMDRKTGKFERHLYDPAHPEKLSRPPLKRTLAYADDHIVFINEDNSGRIWIGTFQNGVNVYDPKTQKTTWYGHDAKGKDDTRQNELWANYKTREGVMWISPWLGQNFYKASTYQSRLPHQRTGQSVYTFLEDNDNTLWLGTYRGLVHLKSDHTQEAFSLANALPDPKNFIWCMARDDENKLWLAAQVNGLYRFDPISRTFTAYHHKAGDAGSLASDTVFYVKSDLQGKIWVGTWQGLDLLDARAGKFRHFRNSSKDTTSISDNKVFCIERDKDNNLWVGTFGKGLNKLDKKNGRFKRYLSVGGLSVYDLLSDSQGNLWACTNNGLYRYDKSKDIFSIFNRLDAATVLGISEDRKKNLWLNTSVGFIKLDIKNNEINTYGQSQGINAATLTNLVFTRHNGEVLFGDSSGFFIMEPDKLAHRSPAPTTVINKFFLADVPVLPLAGSVLRQPVDRTKEIDLDHIQNTFSFAFSNIDFVGEAGDIVNSYMLEHYESNWRKASSDGKANYYDIPPGNYIFKVKSVNSDGGVTIKQIAIIVSPPWWKTLWAYILFVLAFAGSLWGFIYYRSRALIKEKRVLEHKVQVRTEEVIQQKEEIEAQRDSLEQTLNELKNTQNHLIQSEKMASLGELTAGIAHEIQNPLNFVNNFSDVNREMLTELQEELDKGDIAEAKAIAAGLEQNEQKINHHGKRAEAIVKGMLEHSRNASGQKEPTDINQLADEYLRLSYHGLRAKDKSFNAELVTGFDPDMPKVTATAQDIGRVLLNLFNNAFYAVNQKQKSAGADYKPEVSVSTSTANGQVVIKVKDNGVGIPDAIKEKIMQPFFTTKPTGDGTGLGLSLTYDMVVKGHGGSIDVYSKEGQGSEFIVTLPLN